MADLDHIYDVDNDVNYTLKDTEARGDIVEINSKLLNEVYPVYFCVSGGWVVQGREYNLYLTEWSNALFNPKYDNDVMNVRVRFYDFSTPSPLADDILIDIDTVIEAQHRQLPVYLDKEKTIRATIGHIRGRTVDFIYVPLERTYYLVNERVLSEDVIFDTTNTRLSSTNVQDAIAELDDDLALLTASQVGYDHTSSGLVAITVQDAIDEIASGSGGGTAASISYDNTGSGLQATDVQDAIDEVVDDLADKADSSSLATVATSGDYGDLINTPDLSALPYLENIAEADEFNPLTSYNHLDYVKYNNKLYICISSAGSTPGSFDPTEWTEIKTGDIASETASTNLLAQNNKNRLDNLAPVATSGAYSDLTGTPSIPAAQVNSDWSAISGVAEILNKPNLATVATSGDYGDLLNTPDLSTKQDTLVSGSNIKTVNGESLLGSSDVVTPRPDNKTVYDSGSVSAASNSWVNCKSWTFPATGIWLVQASLTWDNNSSGYREAGINTSVAQPTAMNIMRMAPCAGQQTTANLTIMLTVTSTTQNYYLVERHNSSTSPLTVYPRISLLRLAP